MTDTKLQAELDAIIDRTTTGQPGLQISYELATPTGVVAAHEPDADHYAASTMKLPLVLAAYRRRDQGTLDLDSTVTVHNSFTSRVGGEFGITREDDSDEEVWAELGRPVTLRWLCRRSIIRSSNLATNLVFEAVGTDAIAEAITVCRADGVRVVRAIEDYAAQREGRGNLVTCHGLNTILLALADGTAAAPGTCGELLGVLADNEVNTDIPPGLPDGTWVAHKNGWVSDAVLDAALIRPRGGDDPTEQFVLTAAVSGQWPNDRSHELIRRLAATAWEQRSHWPSDG
ncbi:serine hydrolase [Microlunatus elymi]|uniref:serine hydrolase n=1 Tax=Microlunatus elymi TaxID=2596828 RepID=UPI00143CFB83|nr:serine hydrolase [Microlunatus elymi]